MAWEPMKLPNVPDFGAVQEYWLDAWQRSVLFLDVLRERGNIYQEQRPRRFRTS